MTKMTSVGNDYVQMDTNLTWDDGDIWKGWTYSPEKNRYYFDDIGNESLGALWNSEFLMQAY
jgi:hypothetical protein